MVATAIYTDCDYPCPYGAPRSESHTLLDPPVWFFGSCALLTLSPIGSFLGASLSFCRLCRLPFFRTRLWRPGPAGRPYLCLYDLIREHPDILS